MPRLIDSSLEKLSIIMSDMGEMAVQCISLATDSYLQGSSSSDKVHALSDQIRQKYFQVEDLIFDMMLKYQPVAEDFRMIRSCTEISYRVLLDLVVDARYDITQYPDSRSFRRIPHVFLGLCVCLKESTASCIIRFTFFEISSRGAFLQSETSPKTSRSCVISYA